MVRVMFWNNDVCVKTLMAPSTTTTAELKSTVGNYLDYNDIQIDDFEYGDINVSKTYKEFDKSFLKAITWLNKNGFKGELIKWNTNKAVLLVEKDDVTDTLELTSTVRNPEKVNINDYMKQFAKSFEMKKELVKLKALKGVS